MENAVIIGLFVIAAVAALLGLCLLFARGIIYIADGWMSRTEFRDKADEKILKTRLSMTTTCLTDGDAAKRPYEASAVVVHTKTEFIRMANYWWDHRIPSQTAYDKFEAISQPGK